MIHITSPSRRNAGDRPRAFTAIELLVVISVIAVLLGLILPAVIAARESSRRIECVANLRQIGIAMNAYCTSHGMFPPSRLLTGKNYSSNEISEHVFILPNLEQADLFNSINMAFCRWESVVAPAAENRTARHTSLAVYLCPSDGEPNHRNSYRFNMGRLGGRGPRTGFDGPFNIKVLPSDATVTDGLARTAFVSERTAGTFQAGAHDPKRDYKHPAPWKTLYTTDEAFIAYCLRAEASDWGPTAGRFWFYSNLSDTRYSHNGVPNDPRASCTAFMSSDNGFGLNPPRSRHPGIVNVLFGDGHVDPVADTVNSKVWAALGTHASGD